VASTAAAASAASAASASATAAAAATEGRIRSRFRDRRRPRLLDRKHASNVLNRDVWDRDVRDRGTAAIVAAAEGGLYKQQQLKQKKNTRRHGEPGLEVGT
jgi:hypothetical protein